MKLNKPIPSSEPVVAQPEPKGAPIPTLGGGPMKKVVGVTGTKFVGGSKLVTTTMGGMEIGGTGGNVAIGDSAALKGANGKNGQPVVSFCFKATREYRPQKNFSKNVSFF